MEDIKVPITADATKLLGALDTISEALVAIGKEAKKAGKDTEEAFIAGTEEGLKQAKGVEKVQEEYNKLAKAASVLKSALKGATDPKVIQLYTKEVVNLEKGMLQMSTNAKRAGVDLRAVNQGASLGKEVFENFFGTLTKATILTAIVTQVAQFTQESVALANKLELAEKQFKNFTSSAEEAKQVVNTLVAVAQEKVLPVDNVLEAGKALLAFGEPAAQLETTLGRLADAAAISGKDFNELTTIYGKARVQTVLFAEDINQLTESGIPIIQQFATQMGILPEQVKKLASEGKIGFAQLELALFNLTKQGSDYYQGSLAAATTLPGVWQKTKTNLLAAFQPIGNGLKTFLTDYLNNFNTTFAVTKRLLSNPKEFLNFSTVLAQERAKASGIDQRSYDELVDENVRQREEEKKLQEAANAEFERLSKAGAAKGKATRAKTQAERLEEERRASAERSQLRASLLTDETEREVALEGIRYEALTNELRKAFAGKDDLNTLLEQAEKQHQDAVAKIRTEGIKKYLDSLEVTADTGQEEKAIKGELQRQELLAEQRKAAALATIEVAEARTDGELAALKRTGAGEKEIQAARLEADKLFKIAQLQVQLKFQQDMLAIYGTGDAALYDATLLNIEKLQQLIANAQNGLADDLPDGGQEGGIFGRLVEALGISADTPEGRNAIEGLKRGVAEIGALVNQLAQAEIAAADAKVEARKKDVDSAEEYYNKQKELADAGFASDLQLAEEQLALAKKREEEALKQQAQAQRRQQVLDTIAQTSSLITASASIYRSLAPLGPAGIAIAVATIAAMFGSFARARVAAARATKFRTGGMVDADGVARGPSHSQGGMPFEMEGGEFILTDGTRAAIVNKQSTKKYMPLLAAVNRDDMAAVAEAAARLSAGSQMADFASMPSATGTSSTAQLLGQVQRLERTNSLLEKQVQLLERLVGKEEHINTPTGRIIRKGNTTIKINQ